MLCAVLMSSHRLLSDHGSWLNSYYPEKSKNLGYPIPQLTMRHNLSQMELNVLLTNLYLKMKIKNIGLKPPCPRWREHNEKKTIYKYIPSCAEELSLPGGPKAQHLTLEVRLFGSAWCHSLQCKSPLLLGEAHHCVKEQQLHPSQNTASWKGFQAHTNFPMHSRQPEKLMDAWSSKPETSSHCLVVGINTETRFKENKTWDVPQIWGTGLKYW